MPTEHLEQLVKAVKSRERYSFRAYIKGKLSILIGSAHSFHLSILEGDHFRLCEVKVSFVSCRMSRRCHIAPSAKFLI